MGGGWRVSSRRSRRSRRVREQQKHKRESFVECKEEKKMDAGKNERTRPERAMVWVLRTPCRSRENVTVPVGIMWQPRNDREEEKSPAVHLAFPHTACTLRPFLFLFCHFFFHLPFSSLRCLHNSTRKVRLRRNKQRFTLYEWTDLVASESPKGLKKKMK